MIVDPGKMLGVVSENSEPRAVAEEAGGRLRRVVAALGGASARETLPRRVPSI